MVYRPPFIKQLDGSTYAGLNCTMASLAMAIIRDTKGRNPIGNAPWYPTPSYLRNVSGDRSGGTTLSQADYVANRYYEVDLNVEYRLPWATFRKRIESGQGAVLQGLYRPFLNTAFDGSGSFSGNHAVFINEVRWNNQIDDWEYLMYDPLADGRRGLAKGPQWIRESLLQRFAYNLDVNGQGQELGDGIVIAAFTNDTENVILRRGAVKINRRVLKPKFPAANVRRAPRLSATLVYKLKQADGDRFIAYQKKTDGQMVDGSRVWYGNRYGTKWAAAKNFIGA